MPEIVTLVAVLVIGLVSGFIGAMVGSGGLLSIPFLIFIGLPPQVAIATNKLGAFGLSLGAVPKFWRAKKIIWKYVPIFSVMGLIGAYIGSNVLLNINEEIIGKIVGVIILLILPLLFLKKDIGVKKDQVSKKRKAIGYVVYLIVMVFAGFFGGGAGTLIFYTLMIFFGLPIIDAIATDSIPFFFLTLTSLIIFAMNGIVDYYVGVMLFLGMLVGGYLGSHTAIKKGNSWIKTLFVIVVIISGIKLLFFG